MLTLKKDRRNPNNAFNITRNKINNEAKSYKIGALNFAFIGLKFLIYVGRVKNKLFRYEEQIWNTKHDSGSRHWEYARNKC